MTGSNPSHFKGDDSCPVERVTWNDAQQFLQQLNTQVKGLTARLPTEAQWEYACRAGTETAYSFGGDINSEQVNFGKNVGKTVKVKSLPTNPWGLYEMHGNVWEWCQDEWQEKFLVIPRTDPLAVPETGQDSAKSVLRGGSWSFNSRYARSAMRNAYSPNGCNSEIGLRLALSH